MEARRRSRMMPIVKDDQKLKKKGGERWFLFMIHECEPKLLFYGPARTTLVKWSEKESNIVTKVIIRISNNNNSSTKKHGSIQVNRVYIYVGVRRCWMMRDWVVGYQW